MYGPLRDCKGKAAEEQEISPRKSIGLLEATLPSHDEDTSSTVFCFGHVNPGRTILGA